MKRLIGMTKQFAREEDGAAMVEYSILIGIISAAVILLILAVGRFVTTSWGDLCTDLETAVAATACP